MVVTFSLLCAVAGSFVAEPKPVLQSVPIVSPEIRSDRTITFRFRSANAQRVTVDLEGTGTLPLVRDSDGVWSVTTKPLAPDLYGYTLNVDGSAMFDPLNPQIKPNLIYVGNLAMVPGGQPWELADVPHGEIHHHFYKSPSIGDQRDFYVYTPPGYREGIKKLPVLYLLHGFSDSADGWTAVGKANVILDNLIAQGKAKPMVVVMPLGYGVPDFASPNRPRGRDVSLENVVKFRAALIDEVLPRVEKEYRVSAKREDRAIAGLSMGGAESLLTGLNNLDKFAYVGAFSAGSFPAQKPEEVLPELDANRVKGLKLLWMSCGTEDGLIGFQRGFVDWVRGKGISMTAEETPGRHQWILWRRNLAKFAGMLFK